MAPDELVITVNHAQLIEPELCIVVPCYNEADRLDAGRFIDFLQSNPDCALLFVNDGSTDQTLGMLTSLASGFSNAFVFDLWSNHGKGEAVRRGVLEARSHGSYRYIGFMDADLSTAPSEVRALADALAADDSLQIVLGSRWHHLGASIERSSKRHYLGRVFATASTLVTGLDVYDTQCGAKMMRVEHLDEIFDEPFDTDWLFDVEILCRFQAFQPDLAIDDWAVEVPLKAWRDEGDSRVTTSDFLKAPWQLARIRRRYDRGSIIAQSRGSERQSRLAPTVQGFVFAALLAFIVAFNGGLVTGETRSQQNADFQVFQAAAAITDAGGNPYEPEILMSELRRPDGEYDQTYRTELDWPDRVFFNPPLWFTMLAVTGWAASVSVVGSAFLFGAALWLWRSSVSWSIWMLIPAFYAWDRTLLEYNGWIGQTGYLLGAGIGLTFWYASRTSLGDGLSNKSTRAGASAVLLAYKPHVWFAQWVLLVRQDRSAAARQFGLSVALGLASIIHVGPSVWLRYVESLTASHDLILDGHSMTFASIDSALANTTAIAISAGVVLVITWLLLRSKRLTVQTEWFLVLAGVQIASGHSLWYDWAWLLVVPLAYRWSAHATVAFWAVYPACLMLEVFNGPTFFTVSLLVVLVYRDLKMEPERGGDPNVAAPAARQTGATDSVPRGAQVRQPEHSTTSGR